ncbi:MAG TPA: hypothetical protein VM759_05755 [Longimicrobium sp.]|nr:hypothetical protein [Longimicrobium sp.]
MRSRYPPGGPSPRGAVPGPGEPGGSGRREPWGPPDAFSREAPGPFDADPFDAGPFTRLQATLRLSRRASSRAAGRRALAFAAVAWVPLLVLSLAQGLAVGPRIREPFLLDVAAHVRYLVALPVLIAVEPWCLQRLALIAHHFTRAGLVLGEDRARMEALVASVRRSLGHRAAEVALVLFAIAATLGTRGILYSGHVSSWVVPHVGAAPESLSLAGWWRGLVSQPLFLLVGGIWVWRVAVWARFLWGVSRLRLRLVPSHPDLAGGLRFLAGSMGAFAPIGFALGTVVAGSVAENILRGKSTPMGHAAPVVATLVVSLVTFAGPLLAFVWPLRRAWLRGTMEYGALAGAVGRHLEERWLASGRSLAPAVLEVPDFSAASDLYTITANVRRMSPMPMGVWDIAPLAVATLLPFVPLFFLVIPVDELLKRIAQFFL